MPIAKHGPEETVIKYFRL